VYYYTLKHGYRCFISETKSMKALMFYLLSLVAFDCYGQEGQKSTTAHLKVRVIELVSNVPSQHQELLSLQ